MTSSTGRRAKEHAVDVYEVVRVISSSFSKRVSVADKLNARSTKIRQTPVLTWAVFFQVLCEFLDLCDNFQSGAESYRHSIQQVVFLH